MANFTPDVTQDYTGSFDEEVHTEYIVKEEDMEKELNLDIIPHPGDHNVAQQPGELFLFNQFSFFVMIIMLFKVDLSV